MSWVTLALQLPRHLLHRSHGGEPVHYAWSRQAKRLTFRLGGGRGLIPSLVTPRCLTSFHLYFLLNYVIAKGPLKYTLLRMPRPWPCSYCGKLFSKLRDREQVVQVCDLHMPLVRLQGRTGSACTSSSDRRNRSAAFHSTRKVSAAKNNHQITPR